MKRGEVYWADLVPRSGSERTGRRPAILVSHDGFNQTPGWKSIIVVRISTSSSQGKRGPAVKEIPGEVAGLPKTSFAVRHQVTTLGEADKALARLELAFQRREPDVIYMKCEPALDWLRGNPRFRALAEAMRLP